MPRDRKGPKRPKPVECAPLRARVVRGPHKDGSRRWYWRTEVPEGTGKPRTVWTGWAVPEEMPDLLAELRASGVHRRERSAPSDRARADGWAARGTVHRLLQEWLADRERHIVERERGVKRPRGTLTRPTWENYKTKAKHLIRHLGAQPTRTVMREHLDQYRIDRRAEGVTAKRKTPTAESTINLELRVLQLAWTWGKRQGFSEPWDLPMTVGSTRASRERVTPTREEVQKVAEVFTGWRRTCFILLANTGARIGTLARLRWGHVELGEEDGWLELDGKSGPERSGLRRVPLLPEALDELRAIAPEKPHPELRVFGVAETTVRGFSTGHLRPACERAGLPADRWFSAHALRRYAVDAFCRAGVPPEVTAQAMGHSIAVMLEIYRSVRPDELLEGFQRAGLGTREGKVLAFPTGRSSTENA